MPRSSVLPPLALLAMTLASGPPRAHAQPEALPPEVAARAVGERYRDGRDITGSTPHRLVLFTFDDGPRAPYTQRLLDYLDEEGIRGIFFATGRQLRGEEGAGLAREIARRGHMLATHTVHHRRDFAVLPYDELLGEITGAQELLERAVGARPWLFRSPGGASAHRIDRAVAELGLTSVGYNQGGASWRMTETDEIVDEILAAFGRHERNQGDRGGIIAMHDTSGPHVDAFPRVVERLRRRNCELLEVPGEELYEMVSDLDDFFEARAGAAPGVNAAPPAIDPEELARRQARVRADAARWCAEHPPPAE